MDRVFEQERFGITKTRSPGPKKSDGGAEGGYGAEASKMDGMMVS